MELNPEIVGGVILPVEESSPVADMPKLPTKTALAYSSGNLGAGVFFALNNYFLPVLLGSLGASNVLSNLLASTHSFEGAVVQPVVGAWSDRTWLPRLGRRRPFIVWFIPFTILFLVLTPLIPQLHGLIPGVNPTLVLVGVSVAIFLFSLTFNIAYDPYQALLPDITPARQRGTVNGIFQAISASGQVVFLLFAIMLLGILGAATGVNLLFFISAAIMAIAFLPTLFGVREPKALVGVAVHKRYKVRDYWQGLISDRQILLYFASQFLLWFGINAIAVNLTRYAIQGLHFSEGVAFTLPLVLLLTSALPVWPLGILSDRIGLKTVFLLGVVCMAGASIGAIFVKDLIPLYVLLSIAGIGNAAQTSASYPLLTRIVFPDTMGLYTGLNSTVTSIAAPASAVIAGLLIDHIGFTAMFPFIATMFVLSLIPLIPLSVEKSKAALAMRAAQTHASALQ